MLPCCTADTDFDGAEPQTGIGQVLEAASDLVGGKIRPSHYFPYRATQTFT